MRTWTIQKNIKFTTVFAISARSIHITNEAMHTCESNWLLEDENESQK